MPDVQYIVIATLGYAFAGFCMALGVIVGLRLALPSLARALVREMRLTRSVREEVSDDPGRPVVTLERDS